MKINRNWFAVATIVAALSVTPVMVQASTQQLSPLETK